MSVSFEGQQNDILYWGNINSRGKAEKAVFQKCLITNNNAKK